MFHRWFDVHNKDHMEAFGEFRKTGRWPEEFIPLQYRESCYLETQHILADMAQAWWESENWKSERRESHE